MSTEKHPITKHIEDTVNLLVDDPSEVVIEEKLGTKSIIVNITVPKPEVGKIIGKEGKLITAIRTISETIAAKNERRISIHIID